jgi:hypothetical protein
MQILFKWKKQKHLNEKLPWKLPFYLHWLFEDCCRHSGTWNQRWEYSREPTQIFRAVGRFFCQRRMPVVHWTPTLTRLRQTSSFTNVTNEPPLLFYSGSSQVLKGFTQIVSSPNLLRRLSFNVSIQPAPSLSEFFQ